MKITDTKIESGGVYRCCLESIGSKLKTAEIGDKDKCKYCNEPFTLVNINGVAIWIPDWQLKGE
jgi:hypothetical protein